MGPREKTGTYMTETCPVIFAQNTRGMAKAYFMVFHAFLLWPLLLPLVWLAVLLGELSDRDGTSNSLKKKNSSLGHLNEVQTFILAFKTLYYLYPTHYFSLLFHHNFNTWVGWVILPGTLFIPLCPPSSCLGFSSQVWHHFLPWPLYLGWNFFDVLLLYCHYFLYPCVDHTDLNCHLSVCP